MIIQCSMSAPKHWITCVILPALTFGVIHSSNCTQIWKSATVYFQLMTKRWTAVIWCIVMFCPPRLYKCIYCSVNLFNRWKNRGEKSILKQIQISYRLTTAHIYTQSVSTVHRSVYLLNTSVIHSQIKALIAIGLSVTLGEDKWIIKCCVLFFSCKFRALLLHPNTLITLHTLEALTESGSVYLNVLMLC